MGRMTTAVAARFNRLLGLVDKSRTALRLLFSASGRAKLAFSILGSLGVAALEMVGVAAMLPLMQILTGSPLDEGFIGWLSGVLGPDTTRQQLALVVGMVAFGSFTLKAAVSLAFQWWNIGFLLAEQANISTALLHRYLTAPYWLHLQRNTASLLRTMNEAVGQTYNSITSVISLSTHVAISLGIIGVLFVLTPGPAVIVLFYFGMTALAFHHWSRRRIALASRDLMAGSFKTYQTALHALGGVKEIKVRQKADHFLKDYRQARQELAATQRVVSFLTQLPRNILEVAFTFGVATMTVAAFAFGESAGGIAVLGLFVAAAIRLMPSVVAIMSAINSIRTGRRALSLVLADLSQIGTEVVETRAREPIIISRELRVKDVSFKYPGTEIPVLQDVSFGVPAGDSFAIVGGSGAGKSTLVDLILGLHEVMTGAISVDGRDIRENLPGWQRTIGLVPQDVYLLDDTLRANIAFGEDYADIDHGRVEEVVRLSQLEQVVTGLPAGLDSFIGDRGVRLSGGQRQRIGIARALYLRPQLLVLDEATSALDNETERSITETIEQLHGKMTIIIVAHRLSTVRRCDRLLFLNNGTVEATGTFDQVQTESPAFARQVDLGTLMPSAFRQSPPG
jgi:ATP-binding cassette, subfamily B, bacterial PglK